MRASRPKRTGLRLAATGLALLATLALLLGAACGGGDDDLRLVPNPGSPTVGTPETVVTVEPTPDPKEFRVAFINLMSPVTTDTTNTAAADTFDDRLDIVIGELKEFKPDLVAFNESTTTAAHGAAAARLSKELKMEPQSVRANPWFPGQSKEQNEQIAKQIGFEEGELILVGSRFPILGAEPFWLNPRTSETEGRAALYVKVKGPPSVGTIDVFISHLTGDARIRGQQAISFAQFIKTTRGSGPALVFGDLGDPAGSPVQRALLDIGMTDLLAASPLATCCREAVIGQQPEPETRTDYIFASQWTPSAVGLFASRPKQRADGSWLYASDHNGLTAVFPIGGSTEPP